MLFAAAGGTILAGVSYAVARQAQTKRRQAIQVENAASCTPQQLLSQHKHANYNKTFHRYVALEGIINTNTPVTFNVAPSQNIYSSSSESKIKQTPSIDVDAVYFSRQLSDQLYRCKFETKKITRSTTNQSQNGPNESTTTSNNQRNQRNQRNNATADRPKGKVECQEYWSTSDPQHKMALTSIYLEHFPNGAAAVQVTNNKTNTNHSSSTKESKIAIQGINISDFSESSRVIKNQFVSSHVDPAVITSQKNQHKLIVLSAAGSNIVLNELTPVKLGTREIVKGVTCGDTMVCIGTVTVDEGGDLRVVKPTSEYVKDDRPFVLSNKSKYEISNELRNEAGSLDFAATVLGVSAGGLLAATMGIVARDGNWYK